MKRISFFRVLALTLALLTGILCLAACGPKSNIPAGTTAIDTSPSTSTGDGGNTPASLSAWNVGTEATFKVVTPKTPTASLTAAKTALLEAFRQKTGVAPAAKTDEIKKTAIRDTLSLEILLGRTAYDETATVLGTLTEGQFAIALTGNKLVITAPNDGDLAAAVAYFTEHYINVMPVIDGKYSLSTATYVSPVPKTGDGVARVNGTEISSFGIVYETARAGYDEVARYLQEMMKELGYDAAIYGDTYRADSGTPEILIGKTNRAVSSELYGAENCPLMNYTLTARGNKLQIVSGGPYSAYACVNAMRFSFFGAKDPTYADGVILSDDLSISNPIPEGTDLRIMTYNVLAERWAGTYNEEGQTGCLSVPLRAEIVASVLAGCLADAVGLQETDRAWIDILPYYLDLLKTDYNVEYTWKFYDFRGLQTLTTVLYRSDRYTVEDSGIQNFSYWEVHHPNNDYNLRLVEWVYLKPLDAGGKEFILVNTHWGELDDAEKGIAAVDEEITLVNSLQTAHPTTPIFCTGDFNSSWNPKRDPAEDPNFAHFKDGTGMRDSCQVAVAAGTRVNDAGGCAAPGAGRGTGYSYIDHVIGSLSWTVVKYETIVGNANYASDHSPHVVDFRF